MNKNIRLPKHIAFIMDGNGRWAQQRGLSRLEGHQAGVESARPIIAYLNERHVKHATLYSFSTENWYRPKAEVGGLLRLLEKSINEEAAEYHRQGVRLNHIGRLEGLSTKLKQSIYRAIELTRNNKGLTLNLAFNYGGRTEIVDAARRLIADAVPPEKVDEKLFASYLYAGGLPDVDLVVRTGGELRVSNFLLWQSAYSEFYFTPVLWPDFNEAELEKALLAYSQRQRRFGGLASISPRKRK